MRGPLAEDYQRLTRAEQRLKVLAMNVETEGSLSDAEFNAFTGLLWLLDPDGDIERRQVVVSLALLNTLLRNPGRMLPVLAYGAGRTARIVVMRELKRRMKPMAHLLDFFDGDEAVALVPSEQEAEYLRRIEEESDGEHTG